MTDMDRKIAELRGECPHADNQKWLCEDCCGDCGSYSTSIAHAMELWEEMKVRFAAMHLSYMPDKTCRCYLKYEDMRGPIIYNAPTEDEAICGAWLKWKEGE